MAGVSNCQVATSGLTFRKAHIRQEEFVSVSAWFGFSNADLLHLETDLGTSIGGLNERWYLY
ncbi:MAG: hypothetical protein EBY17_09405 [Acidobacteriia bacterium]|nr:hypothetical protein [Terriglobia bacterium]